MRKGSLLIGRYTLAIKNIRNLYFGDKFQHTFQEKEGII
jgi:hypothetical protein